VPDDSNVNEMSINDIAPLFAQYASPKVKDWLVPDVMIDAVYIENQPMGLRGSARNLKTKVLSHILQCLLMVERPSLKVHFINPSLKLKDMLRDGPSSYYANKKYASQKTLELIKSERCVNQDFCKSTFETYKKKDDLADAFLQGLYASKLVHTVYVPKAAKTKVGPKMKKSKKVLSEKLD
jgi:spore coat protein CotH